MFGNESPTWLEKEKRSVGIKRGHYFYPDVIIE